MATRYPREAGSGKSIRHIARLENADAVTEAVIIEALMQFGD
ncbi:hypothetical protein ACWCQQ_31720 [Streptomyces sp. NPDC002143]